MDLLDRNKRGHCCQNNLCNPIHRSIHRSFSHWRRNTHPQNHNNKIMMPLSLSLSLSLSSSFAMLVAFFCFAFAFAFALLAPWHPKQNKATKTTTTQKPKLLQQIKETKSSTTNPLLQQQQQQFFFLLQQLTPVQPTNPFLHNNKKNPPEANKQTYSLTYLLTSAATSPFIHILTTTKRRWRNERDENKIKIKIKKPYLGKQTEWS